MSKNIEYNKKYRQANIVQVTCNLNKTKDKDIIDYLADKTPKSVFIKSLIRADLQTKCSFKM